MKRTTKIWLTIAAFLALIGCMILGDPMNVLSWDSTKLSTTRFETNQHEIHEDFKNISLETDTADLIFALSEDGKCRVECYEEPKATHSVFVENDTLTVQVVDKKSWYDSIGIHFDSPKVTIYLPKAVYSDLSISEHTGDIEIPKDFKFESSDISLSTGNIGFFATISGSNRIKTSTGNICLENTSAGTLDLTASTGSITVFGVACKDDANIKVSTGKTTLTGLICKNLVSSGSTGNISLEAVTATEKISVERSTGDVKFECADAAEIFVQTDTGDVTGSLLTDKVFITQSDTGRIDVPKTVSGGKCEIITDTGNIKITIEKS